MRKLKAALLCALLSLLLSLSALAQSVEILDLTKKTGKPETGVSVTGGGGLIGGTSTRKATLPLRVKLEKLDKQQYETGERFVYEISLENIGNEVLLLPWEPDEKKIQSGKSLGKPAESSVMYVSLAVDELDRDVIFGAERIFSASSMPGTYKRLSPGQKVMIRASGVWFIGSADASKQLLLTLPRRLAVRAKIKIGDYPTDAKNYDPAFSNALTIDLTKRVY